MNRPAGSHSSSLPLDRIRIVLSHTSHPGNIGAAARAMKTMGLSRLFAGQSEAFSRRRGGGPGGGADDILARPRCVRASMRRWPTVHAYAVSARQRNLGPPALPARQAAAPKFWPGPARARWRCLRQRDRRPVERRGAALPAYGLHSGQPRLHLAQPGFGGATAVLRTAPGGFRRPAAGGQQSGAFCLAAGSHQDVERFYEHLERVMVSSGFLDPQRPRGCCPSCVACSDEPNSSATRSTSCADCSMPSSGRLAERDARRRRQIVDQNSRVLYLSPYIEICPRGLSFHVQPPARRHSIGIRP
jgi:tRNA/rRNA methyltransferase